jgi:hypothetical protein
MIAGFYSNKVAPSTDETRFSQQSYAREFKAGSVASGRATTLEMAGLS